MKAELKALAKESFLEELERLRLNNTNIIPSNETDSKQITHELYQLQSVVEELRRETHHQAQLHNGTMRVEWSNPIVREQGLPSINHGFQEEPATSRGDDKIFVLSCAPIQGFNRAMNAEGGSLDAPLSLLDQANRFAEMQSLFHLPAHLSEEDVRVMQPSRNPAEVEAARQIRVVKQKKLQSSIETHVDRLDKGRNPPRRFPTQTKPSDHFTSPRAKIHRPVNTARTMDKSIDLSDSYNKFPTRESNNQYGSPPRSASNLDTPVHPGFSTPAAAAADTTMYSTNLGLTTAIENALASTNTTTTYEGSPSGKKQQIQPQPQPLQPPQPPAPAMYTTDEFKDKTDK